MFVLRKEQLECFGEGAKQRFIDQLRTMMATIYPQESAKIGLEGVRSRVENGMEQAMHHAITEQNNIRRYIHLMFLFETDELDTSPETEWAARILAWKDADEYMKLAALEKRARQILYSNE